MIQINLPKDVGTDAYLFALLFHMFRLMDSLDESGDRETAAALATAFTAVSALSVPELLDSLDKEELERAAEFVSTIWAGFLEGVTSDPNFLPLLEAT